MLRRLLVAGPALPCAMPCADCGHAVCKLRTPGVEPGSQAWGACMMPLHYVRSHLLFCLFVVLVLPWLLLVLLGCVLLLLLQLSDCKLRCVVLLLC